MRVASYLLLLTELAASVAASAGDLSTFCHFQVSTPFWVYVMCLVGFDGTGTKKRDRNYAN